MPTVYKNISRHHVISTVKMCFFKRLTTKELGKYISYKLYDRLWYNMLLKQRHE